MIETIIIDTIFPDYKTESLKKMLSDGWSIIDKSIIKDRYIHYVLRDKADQDVGKCSNG